MKKSDKHGIKRRSFLTGTAAAAGATLFSGVSASRAESTAVPSQMPQRPFGRTGVDVSIVGVGCGSRFYQPIPDDESAAELLRRAIDRGVCVIETSANYGLMVSARREWAWL